MLLQNWIAGDGGDTQEEKEVLATDYSPQK